MIPASICRTHSIPLALTDDDLVALELDVLHSEMQAFDESQSRSVEQHDHEPLHTAELSEQRVHLLPGEHYGQPLRPLRPDDTVEPAGIAAAYLAVEEQQRSEGLVLGRALTLRCTARAVRNAVISTGPISAGWRF
jgi:hypothetical protein